MFHFYYIFHIYPTNINHHMKSIVCSELQSIQLCLRNDVDANVVTSAHLTCTVIIILNH